MPKQISQSDLASYLDLSAQARSINSCLDLLKKSLHSQHEAGDPIEPGRLTMEVMSKEQPGRFSADNLVGLVGYNQVQVWKSQLPPTISRTIDVHDAPEPVILPLPEPARKKSRAG